MRKRFEQQPFLDYVDIKDIDFGSTRNRSRLAQLYKTLQEIFITPEYNKKIFEILEKKIVDGKKETGREGMELWIIFLLAQTRLCMNIDYETLLHMANYDYLLRQLMGIETIYKDGPKHFKYQTIVDNVDLIDDQMLKEINDVILSFNDKVFKEKAEHNPGTHLKTDSYVIQSNVHFPTDYNLLLDSSRKCLDIIQYFLVFYPFISGWRKIKTWRRILKNGSRSIGNASRGGGKNKDIRMKKSVRSYLLNALKLSKKLKNTKQTLPQHTVKDIAQLKALEVYIDYLDKHIDLLERRIINNETIPHSEKMFSIFETYTEWITKGKLFPPVELGKKLLITTNQDNLIVDYLVMDNISDSESVKELSERIALKYKKIETWSFDKGFYSKVNKTLLFPLVNNLIMPKKGKRNSLEKEEESLKEFKKWKGKHSAIESNINELEHCGLGRCPDKGYDHFKRYIGLGVTAYNLRRIGKNLIEQDNLLKLKSA